jgi:hypothetical protein
MISSECHPALRSADVTSRPKFLLWVAVAAFLLGIASDKSAAQTSASTGISEPKYSENIAYTWPDEHVAIEFDRVSPNSAWVMTLRDSWYALEQAKEPGKTWDETASRCRREECLRFIEIGLTRFQAAKPEAKIGEFVMEMQVNTELWSEVLAVMREAILGLKGPNPGGSFFPDDVIDQVLRQERSSKTIKDIVALLASHGLIAGDIGFAAPPSLRPSLKGKSWRAIAKLPDAGMDVPPIASFEVSERR